MTNLEIIAALAEHAMNWYEKEIRKIPCWITENETVARTVREWDPLNKESDTWMIVDGLAPQGITPNRLYYNRGKKEWSMSWTARGPKIFDSFATDVSRRRAICLSALLVLGIAVEEGENHA